MIQVSALIPNTFYAQEHPGCTRLALMFPGLHYTNTHPALYYTRLALQAAGAEVCTVDTDYSALAFQALPDAEQMWLGISNGGEGELAVEPGWLQKTLPDSSGRWASQPSRSG